MGLKDLTAHRRRRCSNCDSPLKEEDRYLCGKCSGY